jgi:hypothetical protein
MSGSQTQQPRERGAARVPAVFSGPARQAQKLFTSESP